MTVIYHCPFCGGAAPPSERGKLFAEVPAEEVTRLLALVRDISLVEQLRQRFGTPSIDEAIVVPEGVELPGHRGNPSSKPERVLVYSNLSDVADVQATLYSDEHVEVSVYAKSVRPHASEA